MSGEKKGSHEPSPPVSCLPALFSVARGSLAVLRTKNTARPGRTLQDLDQLWLSGLFLSPAPVLVSVLLGVLWAIGEEEEDGFPISQCNS